MSRFSILLNSSIKRSSIFILFVSLLASCLSSPQKEHKENDLNRNPAADGFDTLNSDKKAIEWADAVMKAMGGRAKWDETRYLSWNFFGRRDLWWDKYTGDVRIESLNDSIIYLTNINTNAGKVKIKGRELTDLDSLSNYLERAKSIWINDSYWLVMPFKLKDNGVTLKYLRDDSTMTGMPSHVLGLTFENVGDTPENKYEIFITKSDSLVKQWAFYEQANQDSASAIWPWDNYKNYNGLKLSSDRSDNKGPHNVNVYDTLSADVFNSFDWRP